MTKSALREIFIQKRLQLSEAKYRLLNNQLLYQFQQLDLQAVNCLHLFLPILQRKEPDTLLIREWLQAQHPQIQLVYPKTNFADCSLQHFAHNDQLQIAINKFQIPEPVSGTQVAVDAIDLIVVPLLAFNLSGFRVGYGKGFYDRFIAQCRTDVQTVGLSFFGPVDRIDDVNEYDIRMQQCITPEKTYCFSL